MNRPGRTLRWTSLLGILLLASGCGRDDQDPQAAEGGDPEPGGTAILVEGADMNLPLPVISENTTDGNMSDIMYMTLLRGVWRDGRLEYVPSGENPMALASRYELVGPDSATLRYHLRTDARWSDGRPITAQDVAFTYEIVGNEELASPRQDNLEYMDSVVANNDSTVSFHFSRRYPEMLFHSGIGVIPKHVYEGADPASIRTHSTMANPGNGALVVSGAFMISRWDKGQQVVLVPNPHFQPKPHLDQIVIRIIPEPATRIVELQTGNVDMVPQLNFDQLPALKAQAPHVRFELEQKRFYDYIAYNPTAHPAFADREIRRALGMALNVPAILQGLQMQEYAEQAGGPYAPIFSQYYDPSTQAPLPFDLEGAKRVLEAKGWRDTNGDGIREKDGRTLSFTMVTNAGNTRRADISQIVQQQWRALGVDAQLRVLEFNTLTRDLVEKRYEAALQGWSVGLSPDITALWGPEVPFNFTGYRNPELDRLFAQAGAQPTEELALPFWKQAAAILSRDQPYTWLFYMDGVDGVNNRLRNTKIDTFGRYQNVWEWWIPRSQQRNAAAAATAPDSGQ